jgi:GH24 family phage-related lysozyme (muramidase)
MVVKHHPEWLPIDKNDKVKQRLQEPPYVWPKEKLNAYKELYFDKLGFWHFLNESTTLDSDFGGVPFPDEVYHFHPIAFISHLKRLFDTTTATKTSSRGIDLIAEIEGFESKMYNDAADHCTIGYGHLIHKDNCNNSEPEEFKEGITKSRAKELLAEDVVTAEEGVKRLVKVDLNQNQFDALVSFTYNLGEGNLKKNQPY